MGEELQEETELVEEEEEIDQGEEAQEGQEEAAEEDVGETDQAALVAKFKEVQDKDFVEVRLPADVVTESQQVWSTFINSASSREAAGEAIYAALFDSAPSLQSLFKTARSVMAMRFMNGLNSIISAAASPSALKITVETLGFQHLDLDVTVPRVVIFRDAIIDLFTMEMGARFTSKAKLGFMAILNYVGGAYIYIRREYAVRIRIINKSWRTANNKAADFMDTGEGEEGEVKEGEGEEAKEEGAQEKQGETSKANEAGTGRASGEAQNKNTNNMKVPTTFNEMFMFNGAVMGFGQSAWMNIILDQFDAIVENVANSYRLQEECDVCSLVMAKYRGTINLGEFKAVMLASLRSLCPKDWDGDHEVSWGWLWENVERMLKNLMGKPQVQEKALERLIMSLTEDSVNYLRREVYKRFFALAPAGQDYFKQSTTRLYWIADKIVEMTIEMFREPRKMVEEISALGLRHVGYAIPTEFMAPFVSGAVEVVRTMTTDENAIDGFQWSLTLISKILVRTILEGSTIVMKAINTNKEKALVKAISVSPRGKRAIELLNIAVGTQSISPFYWAIESGSLETAQAMINDLLSIRADRDNYYYGYDELFTRHPEVIQRLCADAANLLWPLLDGLIWRSRTAVAGQRRVNYYIKHLMQDSEGKMNKAMEWLADNKDPKIICHPSVVTFSDVFWGQLANRYFLLGRLYFLFTLIVFLFSQSILNHLHTKVEDETEGEYIAIFVCRLIVYLGSMTRFLFLQTKFTITDCRTGSVSKLGGVLPIPNYLFSFQQFGSLMLTICLVLMLALEPVIHCLSADTDKLFYPHCTEAKDIKDAYSVMSAIAMLLYWLLLTDLTVFSMRFSAFLLVVGRVVSEVGLFLGALVYLIVSFASAISSLNQKLKDFAGMHVGALSLWEMALGMYPTSHFEQVVNEAFVMIAVAFFVILVAIFLLNLLIAQLNGAYQVVYEDMVGYARLNRAAIIVTTMEQVSDKRWSRFLQSLKFEERLEFGEGDIGLPGGLQLTEPSNANPTTVDAIKRFGGSTSPTMPWPEEDNQDGNDDDKFDRLEKLIVRATKNMGSSGGGKKGGSSSAGASGSGGGSGGGEEEGSE